MNAPIWTTARVRIVTLGTLFGVALANGMVLMIDLYDSVLHPYLGSSKALATGWIQMLSFPLFMSSYVTGIDNPYVANGIVGGIAGAIIGLFVSEFTADHKKGPKPQP